jgi:hypothetical protein
MIAWRYVAKGPFHCRAIIRTSSFVALRPKNVCTAPRSCNSRESACACVSTLRNCASRCIGSVLSKCGGTTAFATCSAKSERLWARCCRRCALATLNCSTSQRRVATSLYNSSARAQVSAVRDVSRNSRSTASRDATALRNTFRL